MKRKHLLFLLLLALFAPWAANAQQALPYSYGFENNDLDAEGWTVQKTSSYTGISTSAKHEGSYGFQFNYSERNAYLVSPVLSGTESGVALSFYYKESSSDYGDEQFYVGYTTDATNTDPTTFTYGSIVTASLSWEMYETTLPAGVKRIAVQYVYNDAFYLYIDDFTFEAPATCAKPTNLAFTLTPGNGTIADLSWTENGEASEWQICLNGDETNLITARTNPWRLTGLTPETTYTAKVRANCGSEQSGWSSVVTFTPTNAYALTVNDGTTTNGYVPIYGYYVDAITESQFIIPARELADMAWGTINKMTFYAQADKDWGAAQFEVYMTETSETTLSSLADFGTMTKVKNAGSLSISGNVMEVILDAPYQYRGGNLMIGFLQTVSGSWSSCSWYGVSAEGASMGGYGSSISQQNFLPKTTFDYIPGEEPACMWPTNLAVSNVTAHTAELSWTSDGTAWQIGYSTDGFVTEQYVEVTENPYTLTRLDPETDYEVRVQKNCGGGTYSVFCTPVAFTTEPSCYAPTDLVISDITAYSANVGWTSTGENFELRYAPDIDPSTGFDASNLHGWTNIDADGDGYEWVLSSATDGIYLDGNISPNMGHNGSLDFVTSGSYSNVYGALTPDNYLVSPQITLGGSISFWAQAQDASYPEEHFGVAVSTTGNTDAADFTTIQEWTMTAKSAGTLRSSNGKRGGDRATGNWYQYTVDLSAYSGQGYVAIRHFDCTDNFLLNVDDIVIVQPGFEMPWVNVTNPTNPQALTNLEPDTKYLVQVRANCGGEDGVSQWLEGTFTTLPACMVPTNLVISNIDKRSADLVWTPNGEETAWQISLNDGTNEQIFDATATTYSFTGLTPETRYIVKVRAVCDATLQSNWSSPATFTTLVACPAPTGLAISDITNVSAVATWTYDGDVELEYAEDVWRHYDDGVYVSNVGSGSASDVYWGIMLTSNMLPDQPLTTVSVNERSTYNTEPITIMIYSGGTTAPGTKLYEEEVTPSGTNGFHEITLASAVTFDATQNLWIICKENGTYPATGCANTGNPNGRWTSFDGETWNDVIDLGVNYTWMIRAAFGNNTQEEWVAVKNPASPQTIAGLTPETNYVVRLRAVCGGEDGESVWVNTSFTTDIACPAPTALGATPYANSAVLSWEGISESYTVRYGIVEVGETLLSVDFEDETIPADFTNSTTYPWTVTEGGADESGYCVIPGNAGVNSSTSDLTLQVTGPCSVSFMAKVSSENNWDWGRFLIDGTQQMQISGTKDWESYSYIVAEGTHTLVWRYYKDSSSDSGSDLFYVDNIAINEMGYVWETTTATTNECTITGLTPMTTYYAQVMGDCGDFGTSEWSEIISFTTTDDLCPVPTNLAVNAETLTATTADLSWEGSPDVESFTVRYRSPEHVVGGMSESFNSNSVPAGWTRYSGLVNDVIAGTATLTTTTSGWNYTDLALGAYNMKVNIYGTSAKYWLVTPEVTLSSGNFSFDLALTDYGNADPIEDATAQADDRFVVLVYANEAWTILREWNNSGSDYVYNTIATTGEAVSIDLSAYVGQAVKIAFYGESTIGSNGDNDLHIDNVIIGNPQVIPATEWQTVTTSDMNVTLTGLTPDTPYEAQVKADCSEAENPWSNTVTFTTLEQTTLTQTIALAAGANWVSFNVDITLDQLKAALAAASPDASIKISGQNSSTTYIPRTHRWSGNLQWDLTQMYKIRVADACEISLEGMPVDPAEHPVTIVNGANYIAFPLTENMSLTDAFAGFAVNGDKILSQNSTATYNRGRWQGQGLTNLELGKGYIYKSNVQGDRTLVFPSNAKK